MIKTKNTYNSKPVDYVTEIENNVNYYIDRLITNKVLTYYYIAESIHDNNHNLNVHLSIACTIHAYKIPLINQYVYYIKTTILDMANMKEKINDIVNTYEFKLPKICNLYTYKQIKLIIRDLYLYRNKYKSYYNTEFSGFSFSWEETQKLIDKINTEREIKHLEYDIKHITNDYQNLVCTQEKLKKLISSLENGQEN